MTHKLSKSASIIKIHPRVLCVGVKNSKPRFLTAWLTGGSYGRVRYRGLKPLWCWTYWKQFEVNRVTDFWENSRPRIAKKLDKKNSRDFLNFWKKFFYRFSVFRAENRPIGSLSSIFFNNFLTSLDQAPYWMLYWLSSVVSAQFGIFCSSKRQILTRLANRLTKSVLGWYNGAR